MEQYSDEYWRARVGQLGASQIRAALAKGKGDAESTTRKNLIAELCALRLTGKSSRTFSTPAIEWGNEWEPVARAAYEVSRGVFVEQVGWLPHPSIEWTGCSPDGLVEDGLLEIKCPNTATHIDYLLAGKPPAEYQLQMLWQMEVTGRKWCDFASFDPRMPEELQLFVVRYERDDERLDQVREGVKLFLADVDSMMTRLREKMK